MCAKFLEEDVVYWSDTREDRRKKIKEFNEDSLRNQDYNRRVIGGSLAQVSSQTCKAKEQEQ